MKNKHDINYKVNNSLYIYINFNTNLYKFIVISFLKLYKNKLNIILNKTQYV